MVRHSVPRLGARALLLVALALSGVAAPGCLRGSDAPAPSLVADAADTWTDGSAWRTEPIVLDGVSEKCSVESLTGTAGPPRADDLLRVPAGGLFWFFRGERTSLRFRRDGDRLLEIDDAGHETLVALTIPMCSEIGPFTTSDAAHLRGLSIVREWEESLGPLLDAVDGPRCALAVQPRADGTLPKLPAGLRSLAVQNEEEPGPLDLGPLAAQRGLRRLEIGWGRVADFGPLAGCREIEWLEAPIHPENEATMPRLGTVRTFVLADRSETKSTKFAAAFPSVRRVEAGAGLGTSLVRDLAPLSELPHLQVVIASRAPVENLPPGGFPALRRISILGHRLAPAAIAAFAAAHPACRIDHDRLLPLLEAVGSADAVRVIDPGFFCERDAPVTDATVRGADAVRDLLDRIRFDGPASGGGACLCADPPLSIVFLRGGAPLRSVDIFHGGDVHGVGPEDPGVLTRASRVAVRRWLEAHGLGSVALRRVPAVEPDAAETAAELERTARLVAILGAERLRDVTEAPSAFAVNRAMRTLDANPARCVIAAIRAWDVTLDLQSPPRFAVILRRWIFRTEDPAAVREAVETMLATPADAPAAARFVGGIGGYADRLGEEWVARMKRAADAVRGASPVPAPR